MKEKKITHIFIKLYTIIKETFRSYNLSDEENNFISLNKKNWHARNGTTGILIEGFLDSPTSIVEKSRLANAASDATDLNVLVIVRGFYKWSSNVLPIYKSFGFSQYFFWWRNYLNPFLVLPSLCSAFYIFQRLRDGHSLVSYMKDGILIGDLIYDTLIRYIPNSYTVDKLSFLKHSRLILRSMLFYYANKRLLSKNNIKVLVTSHNVYAEFGMLCRQAHKLGALVLLKDMDVFKIYSQDMNVNEHFLKPKVDVVDNLYLQSNLSKERKYFQARLNGELAQIDVKNAYQNKKKYNKEASIRLNSAFELSKKNIFVFAHAFSDAPHVGEGLLFKDYYDFLKKTLIKLNENTNINCFVKAHPSSYMWGESGGVEGIIKENGLLNVCILPNDYNTNSIIDVADVIITAKGTAGLEFSCAGIPAITAGKGYYHGFGICHEPDSINEYFDLLADCEKLQKLNEKIIRKALIVLFQSFNMRYHSPILPKNQILPGDDYHTLFREKFSEMVKNFEKGISIKDDFYNLVVNDVKKAFSEK